MIFTVKSISHGRLNAPKSPFVIFFFQLDGPEPSQEKRWKKEMKGQEMVLTPNSLLEGRTILVPRVLRGGWCVLHRPERSFSRVVPMYRWNRSQPPASKEFPALESHVEKYSSARIVGGNDIARSWHKALTRVTNWSSWIVRIPHSVCTRKYTLVHKNLHKKIRTLTMARIRFVRLYIFT